MPISPRQFVATAQGSYLLLMGIWPLVSLPTFKRVTGPKLEGWLVRGMGVVLATVGATLLSGARNRRVTPELVLVANGVGLGLGTLDVFYVARRRIKPVYLANAATELAFAGAWWMATRPGRTAALENVAERASSMVTDL